MLLVAVVFVWSGLTVCYGRSAEAIAHTVERQRDPVLRQKDVKAAKPRPAVRTAPPAAEDGTAASTGQNGGWNNRLFSFLGTV